MAKKRATLRRQARKGKQLHLGLNQDLKIFLASYACARALATAGYDFAWNAFGILVPPCPG